MKKLGYVNGKFLEWNKNTFGRLHDNKSRLWKKIQDIDCMMEGEEENSEELLRRRREVLVEMERAIEAEEIFWH